ncbi:XRE family transcriptional regulator protein (plasmid) [Rhizobium phaseoli]|uniref:helix-turn-helix domain-containing protein n=1 Tax=Rhizobium phaseoli TaxID=396 RepID=UPI0007EB2D75|nr:helix-turn-helix transcriptional regulator [Rhizobium phaseoli]ANL31896.1 XRE family transcriptional regulator protein [Rhizobium phaseoli]MDK4725460.1 helix-turn-helix transcriptional regulator [Rhizobium phaseoli]NKE89326.1 helix-turn-helix transcriptional regulator [Rhizobium phaseoli]
MVHKPKIKAPNAIDVHVGSRIRLQRGLMGMSQKTLADGLGVTFQQVQKYEKGRNRVGSSRLQAIANILNVPVTYFFEEGPGYSSSPQGPGAFRELTQFLDSNEGLALNRAFMQIQDAKIRRKLIDLVRTLAKEPSE